MLSPPSDRGHQGHHGHRTWLHLLPRDPGERLGPARLKATRELLLGSGLALPGPEGDALLPGPAFGKLLLAPRRLAMAGEIRGEVRLEDGVLRCYPDPGPEGFDSDPATIYHSVCPHCGHELDFFSLHFPAPDPMQGACPSCRGELAVTDLDWSPELPVARAELTFADLDGRPSLRGTDFLRELEAIWGSPVREVHVTL